jgi:hypothetical protein
MNTSDAFLLSINRNRSNTNFDAWPCPHWIWIGHAAARSAHTVMDGYKEAIYQWNRCFRNWISPIGNSGGWTTIPCAIGTCTKCRAFLHCFSVVPRGPRVFSKEDMRPRYSVNSYVGSKAGIDRKILHSPYIKPGKNKGVTSLSL